MLLYSNPWKEFNLHPEFRKLLLCHYATGACKKQGRSDSNRDKWVQSPSP